MLLQKAVPYLVGASLLHQKWTPGTRLSRARKATATPCRRCRCGAGDAWQGPAYSSLCPFFGFAFAQASGKQSLRKYNNTCLIAPRGAAFGKKAAAHAFSTAAPVVLCMLNTTLSVFLFCSCGKMELEISTLSLRETGRIR